MPRSFDTSSASVSTISKTTPALCSKCEGFTVGASGKSTSPYNLRQHHFTLRDLRECAESKRSAPCPLCRLFWAGIQAQASSTVLTKLLTNWPVRHVLVLDSSTSPGKLCISVSNINSIQSGGRDGSLCTLTLTAAEGSLAGREILARSSVPNSTGQNPEEALIINRWLDDCAKRHERCGVKKPRPLPTRLIDISHPSRCRLIEPKAGEMGLYAALSYCWGDKINNESVHKVKLKKAMLEGFKKGIDQSQMTKAHLEGMDTARNLGYQYIWIDALCIMQDADDDWARQAHLVPDIYGNAELTIMAGRSHDSRRGFLEFTEEQRPSVDPVDLPYETPGLKGRMAVVRATLPASDTIGPADLRAWCFQELLLSRRVLIYGAQQLMYRCRENKRSERGGMSKASMGKYNRWYDLAVLGRPSNRDTMRTIAHEWYEIASGYSTRAMYDPLDAYAALTGVARRLGVAMAYLNNDVMPRYLAGLWESNEMIYGLMWRSRRLELEPGRSIDSIKALTKPVNRQTSQVVDRAPSWSWMALEGPIIFPSNGEYGALRPYCRPAGPNGAWAPDDWGLDLVLHDRIHKSLPFKLEIWGRPHKVRVVSRLPPSELKFMFEHPELSFSARTRHNIGGYGRDNIVTQGVALSNGETPNKQGVVALGLFDLETDRPAECWALPLLTTAVSSDVPKEGLLLSKKKSGAFCRIGIVWIMEPQCFMEAKECKIALE